MKIVETMADSRLQRIFGVDVSPNGSPLLGAESGRCLQSSPRSAFTAVASLQVVKVLGTPLRCLELVTPAAACSPLRAPPSPPSPRCRYVGFGHPAPLSEV